MISSAALRDRTTAIATPTAALLRGDITIDTEAYTAWGAAVTAKMYLPRERSHVWQQITDYPRWVHYFPDITQSHLLPTPANAAEKRLYQAASKTFLFLTAQVEIYLKVLEISSHAIEFRLESGSFRDFTARLHLQEFATGTLLTYFVQATPAIPVPSPFIQQAIHFDLPTNMRTMRQAICQ